MPNFILVGQNDKIRHYQVLQFSIILAKHCSIQNKRFENEEINPFSTFIT